MSHRPDGANEETKHKLHQTPLFTCASYNYESTGIIDCVHLCKYFGHDKKMKFLTNIINNQCAYSGTSFHLLTHFIA